MGVAQIRTLEASIIMFSLVDSDSSLIDIETDDLTTICESNVWCYISVSLLDTPLEYVMTMVQVKLGLEKGSSKKIFGPFKLGKKPQLTRRTQTIVLGKLGSQSSFGSQFKGEISLLKLYSSALGQNFMELSAFSNQIENPFLELYLDFQPSTTRNHILDKSAHSRVVESSTITLGEVKELPEQCAQMLRFDCRGMLDTTILPVLPDSIYLDRPDQRGDDVTILTGSTMDYPEMLKARPGDRICIFQGYCGNKEKAFGCKISDGTAFQYEKSFEGWFSLGPGVYYVCRQDFNSLKFFLLTPMTILPLPHSDIGYESMIANGELGISVQESKAHLSGDALIFSKDCLLDEFHLDELFDDYYNPLISSKLSVIKKASFKVSLSYDSTKHEKGVQKACYIAKSLDGSNGRLRGTIWGTMLNLIDLDNLKINAQLKSTGYAADPLTIGASILSLDVEDFIFHNKDYFYLGSCSTNNNCDCTNPSSSAVRFGQSKFPYIFLNGTIGEDRFYLIETQDLTYCLCYHPFISPKIYYNTPPLLNLHGYSLINKDGQINQFKFTRNLLNEPVIAYGFYPGSIEAGVNGKKTPSILLNSNAFVYSDIVNSNIQLVAINYNDECFDMFSRFKCTPVGNGKVLQNMIVTPNMNNGDSRVYFNSETKRLILNLQEHMPNSIYEYRIFYNSITKGPGNSLFSSDSNSTGYSALPFKLEDFEIATFEIPVSESMKELTLRGNNIMQAVYTIYNITGEAKEIGLFTRNIIFDFYIESSGVIDCEYSLIPSYNTKIIQASLSHWDNRKIVFRDLKLSGTDCKGGVLYLNLTLERHYLSHKGFTKMTLFSSKNRLRIGKISECNNNVECGECSSDGQGCMSCISTQVKSNGLTI